MTAWREVLINKKCEKCNILFTTTLKFDSIGNYDDDCFELGQEVLECNDIQRNTRFKAWGPRYCPDCYNNWTFDQIIADYESLIDMVKAGRVIVKHNSVILSTEDIISYYIDYIARLKSRGTTSAPLSGYFNELEFTFGNQDSAPFDKAWLEFLDTIQLSTEIKLKAMGWKSGKSYYREDYFVVIDQTCRLFIEDKYGCKLIDSL